MFLPEYTLYPPVLSTYIFRPVLRSYIFTPVLTADIVTPIHPLVLTFCFQKSCLLSGGIPKKSPILTNKVKQICKKNDNFGLKTKGKLQKKKFDNFCSKTKQKMLKKPE